MSEGDSLRPEEQAKETPTAGDVVVDKYLIENVLGEGGMGILFAARHLDLHTKVAIKFLKPKYARDPGARQRFLREARAAAAITSEHAARIQDVGETATGLPFIVMELLQGTDLDRLLARRGKVPPAEAVGYVIEACEAIAEAHAAGIVHRDLKPSNLFVAERANGTRIVKVLDFGISKTILPTDDAPARTSLTAPNTLLGSPQYMSPEQVRNAKDVDLRSDLWALGVILYELVAGAPPFQSESVPELYAMILSSPAPALRKAVPDAPAGLGDVVLRCLVKEPQARLGSVADLALALRPFAPPECEPTIQRIARMRAGPADAGRAWGAPASATPAIAPTHEAAGGSGLGRRRMTALAATAGLIGIVLVLGATFRVRASEPHGTGARLVSPPPASAPPAIASSPAPLPATSSTLTSLADAAASAPPALPRPSAPSAASGPPKVKDIRQIQLLQ